MLISLSVLVVVTFGLPEGEPDTVTIVTGDEYDALSVEYSILTKQVFDD